MFIKIFYLAVADTLRSYLRRELSILELADGEYFHYNEKETDARFMGIILDRESSFFRYNLF